MRVLSELTASADPIDALATVVRDLLLLGLAVAAVLAIACLVLGVVVYRRVRRAAPVRRSLLAVRSQALPPGPARTLAQQRRILDRSLRSTRECVERAGARGQRLNQLPRSVSRLSSAARLLDDHLRDLERELDPARQSAELPAACRRVQQLTGAAAALRDAVSATNGVLGDAEVAAAVADADRQALRLASYGAAYGELHRRSQATIGPVGARSPKG